jgi:dolichol-phosphate mannosyltransferase
MRKERPPVTDASSECIDIVLPVYQEGAAVLGVFEAFSRQVWTPIRVLVCYDREDDPTLAAIRGARFRFPLIPVRNLGRKAHGAVTTGLAFSRSPAVITYMADDDYNAGIIDQMVALFREGCEVVVPSRFIPGGSMTGCRWQKAVPVRLAAFSLRHFARLPVHDPTNGFRLFSRRLLDTVHIESSIGFSYSLELLAKCHRLGWKIGEVPAQWLERSRGQSRFNVAGWAPAYLRWYFYIFFTTYFGVHRI